MREIQLNGSLIHIQINPHVIINKTVGGMQIEALTENGIDKLLKDEKVILQVINFQVIDKEDENEKFILAELSDGYAYIARCFFTPYHFPDLKPLYKVVKVKVNELKPEYRQKMAEAGKKKKNIVLPMEQQEHSFEIIREDIGVKIGDPMLYYDFLKSGRVNPAGCRKLPKKQSEDSDEQLTNAIEQLRKKHNKKKHEVIKQRTPAQQKTAPKPNNPIEKVEQSRNSIKPQLKHRFQQFTSIKQLFLGIENFTVCCRILFIGPMRNFTNKKGKPSQLLNIQFGDQSGTIGCTIFGEVANRYCNLCADDIYAIEGAYITEKQYRGQREIKLNFNETTKINRILEKDANIPKAQQFAISLREMADMPKGSLCTVCCYVKQGPKSQFISKNNNKVVKKVLKLFDLENQIETEMSLINEKAETAYPEGIYLIKGIEIGEYQGTKQFSASLAAFNSRPISNPQYQNIKNIDESTFINISSNQKSKREMISSFYELHEKCEAMDDKQTIWSEVCCYLKAVRLGGNSKTTYLSCPKCKKKVEEDSRDCCHCNAQFEHPKYRYILNLNLIDDHSSLWVNSYDDTGQIILADADEETFNADRFAAMQQETLRTKINNLRYKRIKVRIVSNKQQYNGQKRLKHKIVKVLKLQPANECKQLLEKIQKMIGGL